MLNIEAAQPDPYENIRICLLSRSRLLLYTNEISPLYKDPVYMFPRFLAKCKLISHLSFHSLL